MSCSGAPQIHREWLSSSFGSSPKNGISPHQIHRSSILGCNTFPEAYLGTFLEHSSSIFTRKLRPSFQEPGMKIIHWSMLIDFRHQKEHPPNNMSIARCSILWREGAPSRRLFACDRHEHHCRFDPRRCEACRHGVPGVHLGHPFERG